MEKNLLYGKLVRLTTEDPKDMAQAVFCWDCDTEYRRLLDSSPTNQWSVKKLTEFITQDHEKDPPTFYGFGIRTLSDDKLIGFIGLDGDTFPSGEAFVGIGIGEREMWGRGCGTDAMEIILRFAFQELNLRRVSLDVFGYNPRAVRSYEKVGFVHEGRSRGYLSRSGKRWDLIFMGILREEWLARAG